MAAKKKSGKKRATASSMASQQREISVSEFFTKNRHLLGFDSPTKALLTTIKEAVDNSLDACEEAGILPDLEVEIHETGEDRYRISVLDNGPGIVKKQIPKIFGKLLYGSKFHRLSQSRGQQGIGISAAGMYGQLTTGKPTVIESRTSKRKPAHRYEIVIDTVRNKPQIKSQGEVEWDTPRGTRVEIELEGTYRRGRHSVETYLQQTALANPHVQILFREPGEEGPIIHKRASEELPAEAGEIKPHPYGVEIGLLMRMMKETKARRLSSFLQSEFSRLGPTLAGRIIEAADLEAKNQPSRLGTGSIERLHKAIQKTKIPAPPTDCLSPIGEERILASLKEQIEEADFYAAVTRSPSVYRGNPFQVEAGIAYGGDLPADELVTVYRFANRVPLLYQQGACALYKAALETNWRSYGLSQSKGALPTAPAILMVHVASVWVPFTSESKEAVSSYDEILKELVLGLQHLGRKLGRHVRRAQKRREAARKHAYIETYIPHIGAALREILDLEEGEEEKVVAKLTDTLERSRKI